MRFQDMLIESTREAAAEAFKYAKAVPADKLEWKPSETGRSVMDICRELAMAPSWSTHIMTGEQMPPMDEAAMEEFAKTSAAWTTPEACEEVANRNLEAFYAAVAAFPDERLEEKYTLPFDGGQEITQKANMDYPRWNFTYHLGQIAYIQTLYGDRKMYW